MPRNIKLPDIPDFYDEQIRKLVKRTTEVWYGELITRQPPNLGTPVDTGVLRQAWEKDISQPYTGRIINRMEYAEPVMYGTNLPPSWQGEYKPAKVSGTIKGFPDLLGKEVSVKYVPKLLRRIVREG